MMGGTFDRDNVCRISVTVYGNDYPRLMRELLKMPVGKRRAARLLTLAEIGTLVAADNGADLSQRRNVQETAIPQAASVLELSSEQLADMTAW
jgi:hypothetical protein